VIPLSDLAGEVAASGDGATRIKIGDRVGYVQPRWFVGLPNGPKSFTDVYAGYLSMSG